MFCSRMGVVSQQAWHESLPTTAKFFCQPSLPDVILGKIPECFKTSLF